MRHWDPSLRHILEYGKGCAIYQRSYAHNCCSHVLFLLVSKKQLDWFNRMFICSAFIASNFNYCSTVWHFCSNRSLYKLEKLHTQALRVVINDYSSSYRDLLDKVSKPTLYVSRLKAIATEAYKCKANENPDYINVMLNPLIKPYNLRGGPRAEQPKVNTTSCGLHSFKYQIAKL